MLLTSPHSIRLMHMNLPLSWQSARLCAREQEVDPVASVLPWNGLLVVFCRLKGEAPAVIVIEGVGQFHIYGNIFRNKMYRDTDSWYLVV